MMKTEKSFMLVLGYRKVLCLDLFYLIYTFPIKRKSSHSLIRVYNMQMIRPFTDTVYYIPVQLLRDNPNVT